MPDISSRTFRTVRKGFDPDEVRRYLLEVQGLVNALESGPPPAGGVAPDAAAEQVVAAARQQAEAIVADANRLLEQAREQQALHTWLGPDAAQGGTGDGQAAVVDAAKQADEILAAAKEQAASIVAEAEAQASSVDRWDGLGEHVARIVQQAEEEAKAIVADARTNGESIVADAELQRFQLTSAASAERSEASETLERARAAAADRVRTAEADANRLRDEAEPKARAHIESVLAASRADLEAARRDLETVLDQLQDVHGLVGRSLAHRPALPEFYAAERFLNGNATASTDGDEGESAAFDGLGPANGPAPEPEVPVQPVVHPWGASAAVEPATATATATSTDTDTDATEASPLDQPAGDHPWTIASASEWQTTPSADAPSSPPPGW
jgi:F0F1-type ATP synthase membrane subunit b/b'